MYNIYNNGMPAVILHDHIHGRLTVDTCCSSLSQCPVGRLQLTPFLTSTETPPPMFDLPMINIIGYLVLYLSYYLYYLLYYSSYYLLL